VDIKDRSGFVRLTEYIPDAIEDVRYYSEHNFIGRRIDGYEEPVILLAREAAEALKAASDELRDKGYRIRVFDAYRPQKAVDHFMRWAEDTSDTKMKREFYPDLEKEVLIPEDFIGPYSGHSRGSTVDLTLAYLEDGREADLGSSFDFFGEQSHSDYIGELTEEQLEKRKLLRETMEKHGFSSILSEWWHFRLTDEPYPDTYFDFDVRSF